MRINNVFEFNSNVSQKIIINKCFGLYTKKTKNEKKNIM